MAGMRLALARLLPLLNVSTDVAAMGLQRGTVRRSARLAGVKVAATSSCKPPGAPRSLGARSCTAGSTSTSPSPIPSSPTSSKPPRSKSKRSESKSSRKSETSELKLDASKPKSSKWESSKSESSKHESPSTSKSTKSKSDSSSETAAVGQGPETVGDGRSSKRVSNAKARVKAGVAKTKKKCMAALGRTRENAKRAAGFDMVIGVDEAGRGPFAGPVVAAACFVPPGVEIAGIQDSKKISQHSDREALYEELTKTPGVIWATAEVGSSRIDEINILEATKEAMTNCALEVCSGDPKRTKPSVLVDGNFTPPGLSEVDSDCVIGGDGLEYCIAAASIIAKVTRDRIMIDYGKRWPLFGFERHKGYGTRAHHDAIRAHGMVEIHRRSFLKKMEASGGKVNEFKG